MVIIIMFWQLQLWRIQLWEFICHNPHSALRVNSHVSPEESAAAKSNHPSIHPSSQLLVQCGYSEIS